MCLYGISIYNNLHPQYSSICKETPTDTLNFFFVCVTTDHILFIYTMGGYQSLFIRGGMDGIYTKNIYFLTGTY